MRCSVTSIELEMLLKEHGRSLSAFCYTLGKKESFADDIFQETCLRLLTSSVSIKNKETVTSYLYKVALNAYRDMLRKNKEKIESDMDLQNIREYINNIPDGDADFCEYEALYKAISKLPVRFREVIHLVYFKDIAETDVSKILGIPNGTVKSRLFKAKELLKRELEK